MSDGRLGGTEEHLRAGLRVSVVSIVWTAASSIVAIVPGVDAHSLVLVAFGLTGVLDAAGSAALVVHFRHALEHQAVSPSHERRALRVVVVGLALVGSATAVESARRLVVHATAHPAPAGGVLAAISVTVLAVLWVRKRRIAGRVQSPALLADSWLSATGCMLAVVTVAGIAFNSAFGWWWADPLAAETVAIGAIVVAGVMRRDSSW